MQNEGANPEDSDAKANDSDVKVDDSDDVEVDVENETESSSTQYRCARCGRGYSRRDNRNRHAKLECGQTPRFKCPLCPMAFTRKNNVTRHLSRKHSVHQWVLLIFLYCPFLTNNNRGTWSPTSSTAWSLHIDSPTTWLFSPSLSLFLFCMCMCVIFMWSKNGNYFLLSLIPVNQKLPQASATLVMVEVGYNTITQIVFLLLSEYQ